MYRLFSLETLISVSNRSTGSVGRYLPIFMTMTDADNENIPTIIDSIHDQMRLYR